ncbi:hypothetical protein PCAR4_830146 [Paraburkholderia caribensis]|nr:hypothetical protein PCAR4_830146 [Paraburkholderia caribensis]
MLGGPTAAINHLPQRTPHTLKVTYFAFDVVEVSTGHTVGIRARTLGLMRQPDQLANLVDGKSQFPAAANERQTLQ